MTEGAKISTEAQVIALSQLQKGSQVGRSDLQAAADSLSANRSLCQGELHFPDPR